MNLRRICWNILLQSILLSTIAFGRRPDKSETEFVDIKTVEKTIVVDLRYAGPNNVAHHPLYPPGTPAWTRAGVAQRLVVAQEYLRKRGFGLKIWAAGRSGCGLHERLR